MINWTESRKRVRTRREDVVWGVSTSLPVDLRLLSQSLRTFGHKLKHYLFVNEP